MNFVWRSVGYSLTGDTREQCLFILYGGGANGKSTFPRNFTQAGRNSCRNHILFHVLGSSKSWGAPE